METQKVNNISANSKNIENDSLWLPPDYSSSPSPSTPTTEGNQGNQGNQENQFKFSKNPYEEYIAKLELDLYTKLAPIFLEDPQEIFCLYDHEFKNYRSSSTDSNVVMSCSGRNPWSSTNKTGSSFTVSLINTGKTNKKGEPLYQILWGNLSPKANIPLDYGKNGGTLVDYFWLLKFQKEIIDRPDYPYEKPRLNRFKIIKFLAEKFNVDLDLYNIVFPQRRNNIMVVSNIIQKYMSYQFYLNLGTRTYMYAGQPVEDPVMLIANELGIDYTEKKLLSIISSLAEKNTYHPFIEEVKNAHRRITNSLSQKIGEEKTNKKLDYCWNNLATKIFGLNNEEENVLKLYNTYIQKMLLAVLARAMNPGIKFDHCCIIQGAQGIGKSNFLRKLALNKYYSDFITLNSDSKELACASRSGAVLIELAEIESFFTKSEDHGRLRKIISTTVINTRLPYERQSTLIPVSTVFFGTANAGTFFTDPYGNRRYFVIPVSQIRDLSEEDVYLIWASAWRKYKESCEGKTYPVIEKILELNPEEKALSEKLNQRYMSVSFIESKIDNAFSKLKANKVFMSLNEIACMSDVNIIKSDVEFKSSLVRLGFRQFGKKWLVPEHYLNEEASAEYLKMFPSGKHEFSKTKSRGLLDEIEEDIVEKEIESQDNEQIEVEEEKHSDTQIEVEEENHSDTQIEVEKESINKEEQDDVQIEEKVQNEDEEKSQDNYSMVEVGRIQPDTSINNLSPEEIEIKIERQQQFISEIEKYYGLKPTDSVIDDGFSLRYPSVEECWREWVNNFDSIEGDLIPELGKIIKYCSADPYSQLGDEEIDI